MGFVSLAMSHLPKGKHMKLQNMTTHSNIPGVLLGQMARHKKYRRMGSRKIHAGLGNRSRNKAIFISNM